MRFVALTALLLASPAQAADQWLCSYLSTGAEGSSVDLQLYVEANGTLVDSSALWTPPHSRSVREGPQVKEMDASVHFEGPSETSIGAASAITVLISSDTGLDWLKRSNLTLSLPDNIKRTASAYGSTFEEPPLPSTSIVTMAVRIGDAAFFDSLDGAGAAQLVLTDRAGKTVAAVDYSLSATEERSRMLLEAWQAVQAKLDQPTSKCDKAEPQPE